jgi:hypothetical protein
LCIETEFSRINHNRKGGAFEIEQPKVGPKGEGAGATESKNTESTEEIAS